MTNINFLSLKMQVASQNTGNYFSTGSTFININQTKQERRYQKIEQLNSRLCSLHGFYFASSCALAGWCSPWTCLRSQARVSGSIPVSLLAAGAC